jgi:ribosomal protein L29
MKKSELTKLREKSPSELMRRVEKLRGEIVSERTKMVSGKKKNLKVVRNKRKDLAQILTIMGEKQREKKS